MPVSSVLNQNQFTVTPVLGSVFQGTAPNVKTVRINPSSSTSTFIAGQAMKLISSTAREIVVDVISAGDQPYGVIVFNPKKGTNAKGDIVALACTGTVLWLEASAAVTRGQLVSIDPTGPTASPSTGATLGSCVGVALENASGSGVLFPVEVNTQRCLDGQVTAGQGVGGVVTQATNRSTGVTLNTISGALTTNNASLAAAASATFTVTNSTVAVTDTVVLSIRSGQTNKETRALVSAVAAGSFDITVQNNNGSTAETGAIIINFIVIKAVAS
jgi:hypothetical protein